MYLIISDAYHIVSRCVSGVPDLKSFQNRKYRMKRRKIASVVISSMLELKQFCLPITMPDDYELLRLGGPTVPAIEGNAEGEAGNAEGVGQPTQTTLPQATVPRAVQNPVTGLVPSTQRMLYVPQDTLSFGVEGALFTGRMQILGSCTTLAG